jgi:hypothetical protein
MRAHLLCPHPAGSSIDAEYRYQPQGQQTEPVGVFRVLCNASCSHYSLFWYIGELVTQPPICQVPVLPRPHSAISHI